MENNECKYCGFSAKDENFIFETPFWKVFLAPEQSYLGRSMIVLKRHAGSLSDLTVEELVDFGGAVKKIEAAAKKAFHAIMFNWTCMMNDMYRAAKADPHVHWHVRPRYNRAIEISGTRFTDSEFGQHYNRDRMQEVPSDVRKEIIAKLRSGA
ncbi:MAG: HIT family protein [Candidatus Harrisonbacteria bacterium]|nr:HIT family protein [Candidatus Harrisonbacteria bacterium]MBI2406509.1 HIT family protein [Candidatus Harrisonbacteria bacterium]MBI2604431.1 HIT family protein [Candidatus Harrisonbacteria bacterium]MBI3114719.1 HIT family protein [Candidatus Harrisonbacteria bacterium]